MIRTGEWIKIWDEMVIAYIKYYPDFISGNLRKITENLEQQKC
jgi:hypothetical protein